MQVPRLSKTEELALQLLVEHREMYGLEMVKACPILKRGTVYVLLGRMTKKGFVESRYQIKALNEAGPPKRIYRATSYGRRVLEAWELAGAKLAEGLGHG